MNVLNLFGRNSNVQINGKTYIGNNITMKNGVVIVDGVEQGDFSDEKKIEIKVLSNVESIESKESITIRGNLTAKNVVAGTSLNCDNIQGDVRAGTSVNCDDITGNASAGTTINCDDIKGNATANRINR